MISKKYSKILVTGGAGFIGSHIADHLLKEDCEVTILDNFSTGRLENTIQNQNNKNFHVIKGDIRDIEVVKKAVKDKDAVIHEAALVSITASVENPFLSNEINITGTLNLLKSACDANVKRFILASSAAVYGETTNPKKNEEMPTNPTSPYGVAKLTGEHYLKSFHKTHGIETVSLRYFNVYGPRQSSDIGGQYGGVITIFLTRLSKDLSPIVYGDGEQTRDFIFVKDIAEANICALSSSNAVGDFFNIGSGTRVSVNLIAENLKKLLDKQQIKNIYVDPRPGDVKHGCADIAKAQRGLGWSPSYPLEDGLHELVDWYIKK